jgi:hypothetical protein
MSDMPCFLRVAFPIGDAAPWDRLTPNAFAADNFFNDGQRCELVLLSTNADVERFARKTNVSAGIVAGQYGHSPAHGHASASSENRRASPKQSANPSLANDDARSVLSASRLHGSCGKD